MEMRILAILSEPSTVNACLNGALAAAQIDPHARIESFHVEVDPDRITAAPEEIALQHLREPAEGSAADRSHAVKRVFDTWLASQSSSDAGRVAWREVVDTEAHAVLAEAKAADLLVLARPHDLDAHDALHAVLFTNTRPLLIPSDWSSGHPSGLRGHILIAWKLTDQSRRAVEGAAPWLRAAARLTLLSIGEQQDSESVVEAQHLLRELGVSAELLTPEANGDIAQHILSVTRDVKADALVMGAYRHNAMVEWALGGTTRHMLAQAKLPLFLAH